MFFYRQSDIPEITELTWLLTCVTGKGLLNRAHAYKAAVDKNIAAGADPDADVTAGLFMYPVLMAADILMFKAHKIPVGRDQVQHIEMARDMAQSFNHLYGEHFVLPEAAIDESVAMLPGLDGRKMSKSYDNIIALFAPREQMRKQIAGIVTDSRAPGEPKQVEGSALFQIYQAFASHEETRQVAPGLCRRHRLERRQAVAVRAHRPRDRADARAPRRPDPQPGRTGEDPARRRRQGPRHRHALHGANCARRSACATWQRGRARPPRPRPPRPRCPSFKQYREADGRHYFKLVDAGGRLLAQSAGFDVAAGRGPGGGPAQTRRPGQRARRRCSWRGRQPGRRGRRPWQQLARAQDR